MSIYTALIVQRRVRTAGSAATWEASAPSIRVPMVTEFSVNTADPGGWQDAQFVIPAQRARRAPDQYGSREQPNPVWVMDGLSVAFFGLLTKALPLPNGDVQCFCDGSYKQLAETRMREVWGDNDLSAMTAAPNNANTGQVSSDSNGDVTFSFPKAAAPSSGNLYDAGDHAAVDYYLFGEASGARDAKLLTGWDISLGGNFGGFTSFEVRVYGCDTPSSGGALLQTFQGPDSRQETADTTHGGDNTANWPNPAGYRLFRVGLYQASGIGHLDNDVNVKLQRFNVSTRAITPSLLTLSHAPSTTDIVRDIWLEAGRGRDLDAYIVEENTATVGGMISGNIKDSTLIADGIAYSDWSKPQEIIEMMTSLDGWRAAMYEPTRNVPQSAEVTSGSATVNYWCRQPAELRYEPWADLGEPDYHVRLARGAVWSPSTEPDPLEHAVYVNYTNRKGRTQSVYIADDSTENRMYEQGRHAAIDWQISPSITDATATTLGQQFIKALRQPSLSGTLTLYGDRPGSVELPGGCRLTKLSTIRLGVVRIVDAKGPKSGRITALAYAARTASSPETLTLTVNSPAAASIDRNLARLSHRADVSRNR